MLFPSPNTPYLPDGVIDATNHETAELSATTGVRTVTIRVKGG